MTSPQRAVTAADLRQWTTDARVPGQPAELSDTACILIAAGYLVPTARATVVRRVSQGLPMPVPQSGFSELRRVQRGIVHAERKLASTMLPGVVVPIIRSRMAGLTRRRDEAHRAVVTGKGVFPSGMRAIRRERRENVYLEVEEREQLFAGLLCTPVANLSTSGARWAGTDALDKVAGIVDKVAGRAGRRQVEHWADEVFGTMPTTQDSSRGSSFADGYEALLFVAGHYYDRIRTNPAWLSDHFEMQRVQVNLHAELAEIASDVVALRALRVDLDRARDNGGFDPGFVAHIREREEALRPVWTELIDRVHALIDICATVESAAVELRLLNEFDRATTIDARIDHLLSRSGDRELSADHSRRLSQQVRSGEEQLRIYRDVLQGNIAQLGTAAPAQLPEKYEP
ncbi:MULTISPECIES: hypothetical protein [Gordonia]|uniref:hypothetical protein n=1 Tax=Gordonia TaxID=2053 RepID=UPI0005F097A7|nr:MULTISPECIES: hypothetical protein [Gordonia]KJR08530.1 hypothetical protein UG54_07230 [Gordonia sihwensis]KXT58347.1 hypothetical protein Y710_02165 [Gordonia sp. QH-12]